MNLSFAGCGFLGIYHVGVAVCFKKYAPHLLLDKISGASAGAIAACCLLCDLPLAEMTSNLLKVAREARQRALGPFSPSFNVQDILLESLQKNLPDDAHERVSGKLHISLTRVYDGKNVIVSQFHSREDLLQALLASSFIPLFSGLFPPRFHGIRYMDGGFSDNLPTLDENTITVSPFCGESDICPRDVSSQLFHVNVANTSIELSRQNMYRFARILFPPNPERLSSMCKQGFDDALRFLHRNNLINCNRCLAVQSTFVMSETLDESIEYDPDCLDCKMHRQEALVANLPETVMTIFQDAIDSANKGIINWLFKHRSMKLLSLLSLPYTLPAEVLYATLTKFLNNAPKLQQSVVEGIKYFLDQFGMMFPRIIVYSQPFPQTIKCHVNITEYRPNIYDFGGIEDNSYKKQETNLNLTLQYNDSSPWDDCNDGSKCIINVADFESKSSEENFENILQSQSNDADTFLEYYYVNDNNQVRITEMYDLDETEKLTRSNCDSVFHNDLSFESYSCDNWNEPLWLSKTESGEQHNSNIKTLPQSGLQENGSSSKIKLVNHSHDWILNTYQNTPNVPVITPSSTLGMKIDNTSLENS